MSSPPTLLPFKIILREMMISAKLGVFEWEHKKMREFPATIEIDYRLSEEIVLQDNIDHVIDYAKLERFILSLAISKEWKLLERLCYEMAAAIMQNFPQAQQVLVTIDKPQALDSMQSTAVTTRLIRGE